MERGLIMNILFDSALAGILLLFSIVCFAKLPHRMSAIYHNEHIATEQRKTLQVLDVFLIVFWIVSSVSYVITYRFTELYSYFFSISMIGVLALIIISQTKVRANQGRRAYIRKMYFTKGDCATIIKDFNEQHPSITIRLSAANSAISALFQVADKDELYTAIKKVQEEKDLFIDMSTQMFRRKLLFESSLFVLSVFYLIGFTIFHVAM